LKILIDNSPFDFDEVGEATARRWCGNGFAQMTPIGTLLIRESFTRRTQQAEIRTEQYNRAVDSQRGGQLTGEWIAKHSGSKRYGGVGPEHKVQQFVPTIRRA
jgi:hypothetical protein